MRILNTLIAVVVALAVTLFAVSNRQSVTIEIWPLPYQLSMGLYAVILAAVLIGFIAGAIGAWLMGGRRRREHRHARRHIKELEQSLARHAAAAPRKADSP